MMEYHMSHSPDGRDPLPHPRPAQPCQDVSDLLWSGLRDKRWTAQEAISWAFGQAGLMMGMFFYPSEHARIIEECLAYMQRQIGEAQTALEVEVVSDIVNGPPKRGDGSGRLIAARPTGDHMRAQKRMQRTHRSTIGARRESHTATRHLVQ
jgi:hypothetical protein